MANLLKKIVIGGMIVGASFGLDSCGKRYNIDGSKLHYNINDDLIEYSKDDKIKYDVSLDKEDLFGVEINGTKYRYTDETGVFGEAEKRYKSLRSKMKAIDNDNAKVQKKIQKEKDKRKHDMEVIKGLGEEIK
jgi:hypothetical protein